MKEKLKYHLLMLLCLIIGIGLILILNKLFEKPTVLLYVLIGAIIFALVGTTKVLGNKIKEIDRIKFEEEDQKYKESCLNTIFERRFDSPIHEVIYMISTNQIPEIKSYLTTFKEGDVLYDVEEDEIDCNIQGINEEMEFYIFFCTNGQYISNKEEEIDIKNYTRNQLIDLILKEIEEERRN